MSPSGAGAHRWRKIVIRGLVLLVLGAAALWIVGRARGPEVETTSLRTADIRRTLVVAGRVAAPSRAELGASVSGVVETVRVREGDQVARGDVLVRLDAREARALVAQAEARLVEVRASAADEIERTELELTQATREVERIRAVLEEGGLTRQRLEQAEQRAADAASRLTAARTVGSPGGATATVAGAAAALEAARARLASTAVVAPFDGTVLERLVEPGDGVQPGRGLVALAASGPHEILAFPAEENLSYLRVGASARVSADAYARDSFSAIVTLVAPSVDPAQGTVEVRLQGEQAVPYLRPGMTVSVNLETESKEGAQALPPEAVRGLGTGDPWVLIVEDRRAQRRSVTLGLRGDAWVEVIAGLGSDQTVVLGADQVEPGSRIRPRAGS